MYCTFLAIKIYEVFRNDLGGFFTCASGQMTLGYEGKYGSYNRFVLEEADSKTVTNSYLLSDLSRKVRFTQEAYARKHQKSIKKIQEEVAKITGEMK